MAGDGHDHGEAAPTATGPALPRFAAVSDLFELVGVLNGKQITLYLDRAADNSPVTEAQIELEIGGKKFKAARQGRVRSRAGRSAQAWRPADHRHGERRVRRRPAGEFDIHEAAHADEAAHAHSWKEYAGWAAGGVAVLAILLTVGRRVLLSRQARVGGVA